MNIKSKYYVALLTGFYPAMFFLSNNWHVFSFEQSLILLIGSSLVSLIIWISVSYSMNYIVEHASKKGPLSNDKNASHVKRAFFDPILTVCSMLTIIYLLRNTLASIDIHNIFMYVISAGIILLFSWNSYKKGLKLLLNLLILLTCLAIVNLVINVHIKVSVPIEGWANRNKAVYDQIKFRKSPNVYLIVTESYSSRTALEAVYGMDNSSFYNELEALGMKINHDHFSNYNHTLGSLPSLFAMEHHCAMIHMKNFDSLGGRRMLEAKIYNPVIDIFRANKYKIQYLHNVGGLMPNGAAIDFCFPSPTIFRALEIFLTHQRLMKRTIFHEEKSEPLVSIKNHIARTSRQDSPCFNFIYVDFPGHSPSGLEGPSTNATNQILGDFRSTYYKTVKVANEKLIGLMKFIIDVDQDCIIIMIGDHGSRGYRFMLDTEGEYISVPLYILDRFGVFAGIRAPHELSDLMENGTIRSHVNLFKYVFAYLSEDDRILETKALDDSYEGTFILAIRDGAILEKFLKIDPETVLGKE